MLTNRKFTESSEYLDPNRNYGYFSFLLLKQGIAQKDHHERMQFCYPLNELLERLPYFIAKAKAERKNLFISQASFRQMNRQRASFLSVGCLFVDLDIYKGRMHFRLMSKEEIADNVAEICEHHKIPQPSIILDSGGGMYLKWLIKDPVFKHGLSYWELIQEKLNSIFVPMGADANAKDVSRVLRIVDSVNYKYYHEPLCQIMSVDYENLSATEIKKHSLGDFQPLLPFSLEDSQIFNERMATCNKEYSKNKAIINREKRNRTLILECLKEIESNNFLDGMTPEKLNKYIKDTRQLKSFSLNDCTKFLPLFLRQKEAYAKKYQSNTSSNNNVINSKSKFNLSRRNWNLYQDILELATMRYGKDGVTDGMRDAFMFAACSQFTLSMWRKSSVSEIKETYQSIAKILVPHWTDNRINNCLLSLNKRLKETKDGEFRLYCFSDKYLHNILEVKPQEIQILGSDGKPLIKEMLGEDERNRRDPERLKKRAENNYSNKIVRRRKDGIKARSDYEATAANKAIKAKEMKAQGMKNAQIAYELNVHIKSVSRLLKK